MKSVFMFVCYAFFFYFLNVILLNETGHLGLFSHWNFTNTNNNMLAIGIAGTCPGGLVSGERH
jgi:hypothetical protein